MASPHFWLIWISSSRLLIGMMCIKRRKEPLTIGFCQENKNRNVIPVSEATDQSSPPSSKPVSAKNQTVRGSQSETIWKEEGFLPLFKYPRVWFQCETPPPTSSPPPRQRWPCQRRRECTETFMLDYFDFKEFPHFFLFSLHVWCNSVQIHLDESLINWNKISGCRILLALLCCVKLFFCFVFVLFCTCEFHRTTEKEPNRNGLILQIIFYLFLNLFFFYFGLFSCRGAAALCRWRNRLWHSAALCLIMHWCD